MCRFETSAVRASFNEESSMPVATLAVSGTKVLRGGEKSCCFNDGAALSLSAAAASCIARICNFLRRQPHFEQNHDHDHHHHHHHQDLQDQHDNDIFMSSCACSGHVRSSRSIAARSAVLTQTMQRQVLLPPLPHLIMYCAIALFNDLTHQSV